MAEAIKTRHEDALERRKKFVRYREGSEMYSIGITKFQEIAKTAGAIYSVGGMRLVNTEILDAYLERYRVDSDSRKGGK